MSDNRIQGALYGRNEQLERRSMSSINCDAKIRQKSTNEIVV